IPENVRIVAQFGSIATCRLRRGDIPTVRRQPQVASMKRGVRYSRPWPEVQDTVPPSADADGDNTATIDWVDQRRPEGDLPTGAGTVVSHIDWGLDFCHPDFRNSDGSTRLLALWDQSCEFDPQRPNRYGYGRIYQPADINSALAAADPYTAL